MKNNLPDPAKTRLTTSFLQKKILLPTLFLQKLGQGDSYSAKTISLSSFLQKEGQRFCKKKVAN